MKIGFIGLGRMGKAMVLRLLEQGVDVVAFNRSAEKTDELLKEYKGVSIKYLGKGKNKSQNTKYQPLNTIGDLIGSHSISELIKKLESPRVIWLMVEQGKPVDEMIEKLLDAEISKGDKIIDGGNSFYKDSIRRFNSLKQKDIHYLDIGTSGGLEGARNGACIMVGGEEKIFQKVKPILGKIASADGLAYFGPAGAGHFVKMVHNGIEYGMLQAIGEGFEILEKGPYKLDLHKIALNYTKGSVVRGWLMELLEKALKSDPKLEAIEGAIGGGSTGEWVLSTAKEIGVETSVLRESLEARKKSLAKPTFSGKVVAALRYQFGRHSTKKSNSKKKV